MRHRPAPAGFLARRPLGRVLAIAILAGGCIACRTAAPDVSVADALAVIERVSYEEPVTDSPSANASAEELAEPALMLPDPIRGRQMGRLEDLGPEQLRPLTLEEAILLALDDTAVIRDRRQFLSPGGVLLANPEAVPSVLDASIQQTGPQGVDAALAAFDAQVATGGQWGRNALIQGANFYSSTANPTEILVSESGTTFGRIDRAFSTGGLASLVHNWNYTPNSLPGRTFNSRYVGFLRAEVRQPLWAGRGRQYTDIAGPASLTGGRMGRGVTVACLDRNVSTAQFEARLQLLVLQVHQLYWELWLANQDYQSAVVARDSARGLLDQVRSRGSAGMVGGAAADEAQAEESYYARQTAIDNALDGVFEAEGQLRRLIGLDASDGQFLSPADEPFNGDLVPDWSGSIANALANRLEPHQQRLRIRTLELQQWAAGRLTVPQLDVVAGGQVNGFGDDLWQGDGSSDGAYSSLFAGEHGGWNVGLEFSMPVGFRSAKARERHYQLRLAKARAVLAAQEQEIGHEIADAFHELDRAYAALHSAGRRRAAAEKRVRASQADHEAGRGSIDLLLRAQASVAEAERAFQASVAAYNTAITTLRYREGMLLAENAIEVVEQGE